jgi:hypothetical protein
VAVSSVRAGVAEKIDLDHFGIAAIGGYDKGSEREMEPVAGSPYLGTAGTEHDVATATDREAVFVEIGLKRSAP